MSWVWSYPELDSARHGDAIGQQGRRVFARDLDLVKLAHFEQVGRRDVAHFASGDFVRFHARIAAFYPRFNGSERFSGVAAVVEDVGRDAGSVISFDRELAGADGVFLSGSALDPGLPRPGARGVGGGGGGRNGDGVVVAGWCGRDLKARGSGVLETILQRPRGGRVIGDRALPFPGIAGAEVTGFCRINFGHGVSYAVATVSNPARANLRPVGVRVIRQRSLYVDPSTPLRTVCATVAPLTVGAPSRIADGDVSDPPVAVAVTAGVP